EHPLNLVVVEAAQATAAQHEAPAAGAEPLDLQAAEIELLIVAHHPARLEPDAGADDLRHPLVAVHPRAGRPAPELLAALADLVGTHAPGPSFERERRELAIGPLETDRLRDFPRAAAGELRPRVIAPAPELAVGTQGAAVPD